MNRALRQVAAASPVPADTRCLIYTRVSTEDQASDDKVSLQVQEQDCRAFAARLGFDSPALWPADHESGRSTARLERLTVWCEGHRRPATARGLIVALKRDRWERFVHNDNASAYYEYRMAQAGWDVDFALEPKSGNKTTDAVTAVVHKRQAAEESEEKGRRAYKGMLGQADLAHWMGRAPFGYTRVAVNKEGRRRTLKPFDHAADGEHVELAPGDAEAVRAVRLMFRRAREGANCKAIATELNEAKVPGPFNVYRRPNVKHALKWRSGTVRAILKNPVYGGDLVWNRRHTIGKQENGKDLREFRPASEWKRKEGAAPALVNRRTFKAVETEFTKRRRDRRVRNTDYLLSGLARCGRCGSALVGGGGTAPNQYYRCSGADDDRTGTPQCVGKRRFMVNKVLFETTVMTRVAARIQHLVESGALAKTLDRLMGGRDDRRQARATLEHERQTLEAKRERLLDAVQDGTLTKDQVKARMADLEAAQTRVDRDFHELRLAPSRTDLMKERDRLLQLAADFPARLHHASPAAVHHVLGQWLAGVVVDPSARKGGPLPVSLTVRVVPTVGSQLAVDSPAHQAAGRRCWPAGSRPSCRG